MIRNHRQKFDVAVVGGGPAGCITSILLAQNGVNVCLIDGSKNTKHGGGFRILLSEQAMPMFELLFGSGIVNELGGINVQRSVIKWNSDHISVKNYSPLAAPKSIDNVSLAQILRSWVIEKGVTFLYSTMVTKISNEKGISKLTFKLDGKQNLILSDIVIIASGRTGKRLVDFGNPVKPNELAHGVQIIPSSEYGINDFYIEGPMKEDAWWYALPSDNKHVFLCLCTPLSMTVANSRDDSLMMDLFERTQLLKSVFGNPKIGSKMIYHWAGARSWPMINGENWVAVGDAAYAQHPLSGRGIDFSLFSAKAISEAITSSNRTKAFDDYSNLIREHIHNQELYKTSYLTHFEN